MIYMEKKRLITEKCICVLRVALEFVGPQLCVFIGAFVFPLCAVAGRSGGFEQKLLQQRAGSHELEEGKAQTTSDGHLDMCSGVCQTRNSCV